MKKFSHEKINTALNFLTVIFVAVMWYSDKNTSSAVENNTQTQQIQALNDKMDQWTVFFDKRLDRIEAKLDSQRG